MCAAFGVMRGRPSSRSAPRGRTTKDSLSKSNTQTDRELVWPLSGPFGFATVAFPAEGAPSGRRLPYPGLGDGLTV